MRALGLVHHPAIRSWLFFVLIALGGVVFAVPARAQNEYSGAVTAKSVTWHWVSYSRRVCNLPRGCPWSWNWSTVYSYTCYDVMRGTGGYFMLIGSSGVSPGDCTLHRSGTYRIAHEGGAITVYSTVTNPDGSSNDVEFPYVTWGEEAYSNATCTSLGISYCP